MGNLFSSAADDADELINEGEGDVTAVAARGEKGLKKTFATGERFAESTAQSAESTAQSAESKLSGGGGKRRRKRRKSKKRRKTHRRSRKHRRRTHRRKRKRR